MKKGWNVSFIFSIARWNWLLSGGGGCVCVLLHPPNPPGYGPVRTALCSPGFINFRIMAKGGNNTYEKKCVGGGGVHAIPHLLEGSGHALP